MAIQPCPRRPNVIHGGTRLFTATQPCSAATQGYPRQNKVVGGGVRLSRTKQGCSRRRNVIHGNATLLAAKQGCFATDNLALRSHWERRRPAGSNHGRQGGVPSFPTKFGPKSPYLGLFGQVGMKKIVDKPSQPSVDSPRRGEWGRMFIDNSEGRRPPSPRPPPSRAWRPAGGGGLAGGVRKIPHTSGAGHLCWLAQYGPTAVVPPNWATWTLWQYTDGAVGPEPHQVPGIGRCDRDRFNGTESELKSFWTRKT